MRHGAYIRRHSASHTFIKYRKAKKGHTQNDNCSENVNFRRDRMLLLQVKDLEIESKEKREEGVGGTHSWV